MIRSLAWRQLRHEKLRLLAAGAGITFAVLLQLMQFGFRDALYVSSVLVHERLLADLVLISPHYEYIVSTGSFPRRRLAQTLAFREVESVASLHMAIAPFRDPTLQRDRQVLLLAFNPDEVAFDLASLHTEAGRIRVPDTAIFDARSRGEYRGIIDAVRNAGGLRTEVAGQRIDVVGLFDLGVAFTGNPHVITSDTTFRRILHRSEGATNVGLIRLKAGSDPEAVRAALAATLPADVRVLTREGFARLEQAYWNRSQPIGFIFNLGLLVGLLVGAVIVYQILYADVSDHLGEYATLKAIGYPDRVLSLVVLKQALILSALSFPIGFVLAQVLYAVARQATGLPIVMTATRAASVLALTMLMCAGSGLVATRRLRSADPADVF